MRYRKSIVLTLLLVLAFVSASFSYDVVTKKEKKEFKVGDNPSFEISNISGDIKLTSWEKNIIQVNYTLTAKGSSQKEADRMADRMKVYIKKRGDNVIVKVDYEKDGFMGIGSRNIKGSIDFSIIVPKKCKANVNNVSGDIIIGNLDAAVESSNVSGDTIIKNTKGRLEVTNVSGDLNINGHIGKIYAKTVSGEANFRNIDSSLKYEGVSGDFTAEGKVNTNLEAETVSGDIILKIDAAKGTRMDFDSVSGEIKLDLNSDAEIEYSLKSFSGNLKVYGSKISTSSSSKRLTGKVGSGNIEIQASSMSGSIIINL